MAKRDLPYSPRRPSEYRHLVNGYAPRDPTLERRPYRHKVTAPSKVVTPKRRLSLKRLLALLYDELRKDRTPS